MSYGTNMPVMVDGVGRCRFPYLVSYAYLANQSDEHVRRILTDDRREVLLDSGAFTAFNVGKEIRLSEYVAFLKKWRERLFGYMLLDKIQDPVTTKANWLSMMADGLSPIPIHVFGEGGEQMEEFFAHAPYVALGGFRRPHRGPAPVEYVKQKMAWAAGRPVHWLGYTNEQMIKTFRPFSVDCATVWSSTQFGNISVYLGAGRWWLGVFTDWQKAGQVDRRAVRAAVANYDVNPDVLDDPTAWRWCPASRAADEANTSVLSRIYRDAAQKPTSHLTATISVRGWVRYIYDIRRRYGTRVFLACTPEERFDRMVDEGLELAHRKGWDLPLPNHFQESENVP